MVFEFVYGATTGQAVDQLVQDGIRNGDGVGRHEISGWNVCGDEVGVACLWERSLSRVKTENYGDVELGVVPGRGRTGWMLGTMWADAFEEKFLAAFGAVFPQSGIDGPWM